MSARYPCGWRLSATLLAVVVAAACGESDALAPNHGRVRFVIGSDAGPEPFAELLASDDVDSSGPGSGDDGHVGDSPPYGGDGLPRAFPLIEAANVTFASVLARNLDGVLENVEMDLPVTVDVVELEGGRQVELPEGELPAATYDQVVVVMTKVELVLKDGTEITIDPPGGGWTVIVPLCPPLEVQESGTSTVSLTLDVRNAVLMTGGHFHFRPIFKRPFGCLEPMPPEPMPLEPMPM